MFTILKQLLKPLIRETEHALWLMLERSKLLTPATTAYLKENNLQRLLTLQALHGYIYGRWTKHYINLARNVLGPMFYDFRSLYKNWFANRYHCKVLTQEHAEAIINLDQEIPLQDLERVIPYSKARELVLNAPPAIAVIDCVCRQTRPNGCEPKKVCMIIGQPFVDLILEYHKEGRRVSQQEALKILREEHERGHVHLAYFKDACLDRFYAICNCCSCCCGGIEAMMKYDIPMIAASGYVAKVEEEKCKACGKCVKICPFGALAIGECSSSVTVDWDACMGCGVCMSQCPSDALTLLRDIGKGVPLDVNELVTTTYASIS